MDRRADLQLRLQKTVEGLSVVAISYYAVNLADTWPIRSRRTAGAEGLVTAALTPPVVLPSGWRSGASAARSSRSEGTYSAGTAARGPARDEQPVRQQRRPPTMDRIASIAAKDRVGTPERPAPTVQPPASTPPNPISAPPGDIAARLRRALEALPAEPAGRGARSRSAPAMTPPTSPTPKPAGIDVDATAQNSVSAEGEVKLRLSIAIGSNSS